MRKILFFLAVMLVPSLMLGQSVTVSNAIMHLLDGNAKVQSSIPGGNFNVKENAGTPKSITFTTSTENASTNTTFTFKANNLNYSYSLQMIQGKKWVILSLGSSAYSNSVTYMRPQEGGVGTITLYTLNANKTAVVKGIEVQMSPSKCEEVFTLLKNFIKNNKVNKLSGSQTL